MDKQRNNFNELKRLAESLTSERIEDFFNETSSSISKIGYFFSKFSDSEKFNNNVINLSKRLVECTKQFTNSNLDINNFVNIEESIKLASHLTESICPSYFSMDAKFINIGLIAWMYLVDDITCDLEKTYDLKNPNRLSNDYYFNLISSIMNYYLKCWDHGIEMKSIPKFKYNIQIPDYFTKDFNKLLLIGKPLFVTARMLRNFIDKFKNENNQNLDYIDLTSRFRLEFKKSFIEKCKECYGTPITVEEYMYRHEKTGAVKPCVELNILLGFVLNNMDLTELKKINTKELQDIILNTNYVVLNQNEAAGISKDIGQHEESKIALLIRDYLKEDGKLL